MEAQFNLCRVSPMEATLLHHFRTLSEASKQAAMQLIISQSGQTIETTAAAENVVIFPAPRR